MAITVEKLRNDHRFKGDNVTQFLLYLPIAVCLVVFRVMLALILWVASIILPNKSTVRHFLSTLACWTFGVFVELEGVRDESCNVLVANYVTCLDSLAAAHVLGTISLRKWKVPPFFASTLGIRNSAQYVKKEQAGGAAPLLLQPEGAPGSGRALLRFADWPSAVAGRVQPLAIAVDRRFTHVTVHRGGAWRDALWFLAAPATVYRLTLLPPAAPAAAPRAIAARLQIEMTDIPAERLYRAPPRAAPRRALQVKEVLPRVPLADIERDLAITHSVDVTITNFLEGVTPYTPEPEPAPAPAPASAPARAPAAAPAHARPAPPPHQAPFRKSAKERQLSFQERKAEMIAEARQRYIEKHGLNVALNNC